MANGKLLMHAGCWKVTINKSAYNNVVAKFDTYHENAENVYRVNFIRITNGQPIKNWRIKSPLKDPATFRTPISLARLADLAVNKLIKLMQANSKINNAIAPNNFTILKSLCWWLSKVFSDFR